MAERTISYDFRANFGQFTAGLAAMGKSVQSTAVKLTALDRNGVQMRAGLTQLGNTAGKVGLVAAAGLALAVRAAANFDQAMSNVQAATHETAANMDLLREAAIQAGAQTAFSATEAAGAIEALSKAGVSTTDILTGGLSGALNLASAGSLEVAQAAEIAATTLTQFGLSGDQTSRVADVLAAAAGKAQGEVTDMAGALKYVGPVAAQMGLSLEDTVGTIAELASQGILGEQAGTSLRGMLTSLTSPSKIAAKEMAGLGISMYDASGHFVGLDGIAGQLNETMSGLTESERNQALGRIFGNEQITAARILYAGGAEAVDKWTKAVDDQGYAAETASIKMDNLKGDLEQLGGSLETLLIGSGEGSQGPLRSIVQGTTETVNALGTVPGPAKTATAALLGVTAVLGASVWTAGKVVAGIAATKLALQQLGIQATTTRQQLALVGTGGAAAALGIGTFVDVISMMDSRSRSSAAADATVRSFQDLSDALSQSNVGKYAADLHIDLDRLTQDLADNGAQGEYASRVLDQLAGSSHGFGALLNAEAGHILPFYTDSTSKATDASKDLKNIIDEMGVSLGQQQENLANTPPAIAAIVGPLFGVSSAADGAAGSTDGLSGSTNILGSASADAAQDIADLVKQMSDQKDAAVSAFDAITGYRQAMKDADAQAKKSNAGIAGSSDEMLKNRGALSGLISSWNSLDQTVTDNVGKFKAARANFIDTATAMGVPKKAATNLWREMAKLPSSKVIPVSAPGASAAAGQVQTLNAALSKLVSKTITLTVKRVGAALPQFDTGGFTGAGGRHDVAGIVHRGEVVIPQDRVRRDWGMLKSRYGDLPGFADGGIAGNTYARTRGSDAPNGADDNKVRHTMTLFIEGLSASTSHLQDMKAGLAQTEKALSKASKAADDAQSALQSLRDQKGGLSSSVSGALTHDPFGGSLSDFAAQVGADTADAEAMLAALQSLVNNGGIDPHSAFFQQLAASGNVLLVQQFAALTRGELANYAQSFATGQSATAAAGQFVGDAAFNDLIKAQSKVVSNLDGSVKNFTQTVKRLEHVIDQIGDKVKQGAKEGTAEGARDKDRQTATDRRTGRGR